MNTTVLVVITAVSAGIATGVSMIVSRRTHSSRTLRRIRLLVRTLVADEVARATQAVRPAEDRALPDASPVAEAHMAKEPRLKEADERAVLARPVVAEAGGDGIPKVGTALEIRDGAGASADCGPPPTASLRAIRGATLDVLLTSSTITFGRGSDRDVLLDASTVSRHHFTLFYRSGQWYLRDENSPNGSFLNGTRVTPGVLEPVNSGDRISASEEVVLLLTASHSNHEELKLVVGAATHQGGRSENEDSLCSTETLAVVADGVGGRPGGAVASKIAVDLARGASGALPLLHLVPAIDAVIRSRGEADPSLGEMATTFDGLQLIADSSGNKVVGVHIGDSCALLDDGIRIRSLTVPHTLGGKLAREGNPAAERHPERARLLRAIGMPTLPEVDRWQERAVPGHRYVLSTDGLFNALGEERVRTALAGARDCTPQQTADLLIAEALSHATVPAEAIDNLTVVVADIDRKPGTKRLLPAGKGPQVQQLTALGR